MTGAVTDARLRGGWLGAKSLAWFALAGVIVYVAIDVLPAFLRPRYSLVYNAESDYGRGPWYWVMDLNFLLRCAFSLAIADALSQVTRQDARARTGIALLLAWAVCSGLLAFFADDLEGQPLHGRARSSPSGRSSRRWSCPPTGKAPSTAPKYWPAATVPTWKSGSASSPSRSPCPTSSTRRS